jgi:ribosome-binding factor A
MKKSGSSLRSIRVAELIRRSLSQALERNNIHDFPKILITITQVKLSPDLRSALAFFYPLGVKDPEQLSKITKLLQDHRGYFRHHLAQTVTLRLVPTIRFSIDQSFNEAERIHTALLHPLVQRDLSLSEADLTDLD